MFAFDLSRAGRHVIVGLVAGLAAGCASQSAPAVEPTFSQVTPTKFAAPTPEAVVSSERPAFYLPWKGGNLPGLTQKPQLDRTSKLPTYPAKSERFGEEGRTILEACVTVDGKLVDVHMAESSGYQSLDEATIAWAKQAKYKPAMFGDEALAVCGYRLEWVWQVKAASES